MKLFDLLFKKKIRAEIVEKESSDNYCTGSRIIIEKNKKAPEQKNYNHSNFYSACMNTCSKTKANEYEKILDFCKKNLNMNLNFESSEILKIIICDDNCLTSEIKFMSDINFSASWIIFFLDDSSEIEMRFKKRAA